MMLSQRVFIISATLLWFTGFSLRGQDTFSIVAVDSTTKEVGSAGASCLDDRSFPGSGGAYIISDVLPDIGAVHTQSFWIMANQVNAHEKLMDGWNATQISEWLQDNDAQNNPGVRQYGMVTMDDAGRIDQAAFTGANCFDEKTHRTGPGYAIQGNILISESVLDSMEARFLRSNGPLCEKLMAAMQGANIPGADSRCLSEGVSSQSAFIRVARSGDSPGDLWMDLNVPQTQFGVEPIDVLQQLFDDFKSTLSTDDSESIQIKFSPNPAQGMVQLKVIGNLVGLRTIQLWDLNGQLVKTIDAISPSQDIDISNIATGMYVLRLGMDNNTFKFLSEKLIIE